MERMLSMGEIALDPFGTPCTGQRAQRQGVKEQMLSVTPTACQLSFALISMLLLLLCKWEVCRIGRCFALP